MANKCPEMHAISCRLSYKFTCTNPIETHVGLFRRESVPWHVDCIIQVEDGETTALFIQLGIGRIVAIQLIPPNSFAKIIQNDGEKPRCTKPTC